ncbi:MAG: S8 family serine peptidase [Candidatus Eisenbacteria bacterium]
MRASLRRYCPLIPLLLITVLQARPCEGVTITDPYFGEQWGLQESFSRLPSAWDLATGGPVLIGVVDTGVKGDHEDLSEALHPASVRFETEKHGTCVCGVINATANSLGVVGVAAIGGVGYVRPQLYVVEDPYSGPVPDQILAAQVYAQSIRALADNGVRIINLSNGFNQGETVDNGEQEVRNIVDPALEYAAVQRNCVIVVAAGNHPSANYVEYPAGNPYVINVGAINKLLAGAGNHGPLLDLCAPGGSRIKTTDDYDASDDVGHFSGYNPPCFDPTDCVPCGNDCYGAYTNAAGGGQFGGTSAAAPFLSGVCALMIASNPTLSWSEVRQILRDTAAKVPRMNGQYRTDEFGHGRVDAYAAVLVAKEHAQVVHGVVSTTQMLPESGKTSLYISGDLRVPAGVTLTIAPGTHVFVAPSDAENLGSDPQRVEVLVEGGLTVGGVSGGRVQFLAATSTPAGDSWGGLRILGAGTLNVQRADVLHALNGVSSESSGAMSMTDATCDQCANSCVSIAPASSGLVNLSGCTLTTASGVGVEADGSGVVSIDASTLQAVTGDVLRVNGGQVTVASSSLAAGSGGGAVIGGGTLGIVTATLTASGSSSNCVTIQGGNVDIGASTFMVTSGDGLEIRGDGTAAVHNCTLTSSGATANCVNVVGGTIDLRANALIVNGGDGVEITGDTSAVIRDGSIAGSASSASGIYLLGGTADIHNNVITGFASGQCVWLAGGVCTLSGNAIGGGTKWGIYITSGPHIIGGDSAGGNEIYGCVTGVYAVCVPAGACPTSCPTTFATLRKNNVHDNTYGVQTVRTKGLDLGTSSNPGYNTFTGNATYCIWNRATSCGTLTAQGNWFGQCAMPSCMSGPVDVSNYLCSAPLPGSSTHGVTSMRGGSDDIAVDGVFPNPMIQGATIRFTLPEAVSDTRVEVFDASGRLIKVVARGAYSAGPHQISWDGKDGDGGRVRAGVYFVRATGGAVLLSSKLTVAMP